MFVCLFQKKLGSNLKAMTDFFPSLLTEETDSLRSRCLKSEMLSVGKPRLCQTDSLLQSEGLFSPGGSRMCTLARDSGPDRGLSMAISKPIFSGLRNPLVALICYQAPPSSQLLLAWGFVAAFFFLEPQSQSVVTGTA